MSNIIPTDNIFSLNEKTILYLHLPYNGNKLYNDNKPNECYEFQNIPTHYVLVVIKCITNRDNNIIRQQLSNEQNYYKLLNTRHPTTAIFISKYVSEHICQYLYMPRLGDNIIIRGPAYDRVNIENIICPALIDILGLSPNDDILIDDIFSKYKLVKINGPPDVYFANYRNHLPKKALNNKKEFFKIK